MPLRTKLPLITAAFLALALLAAGVLATAALRSYLLEQVDADLARIAARGQLPPPPPSGEQPSPLTSDVFVESLDTDGRPTQQLSNLPPGVDAPDLPRLDLEQAGDVAGEPFTADGWRVLVSTTPQGAVLFAKSLAASDDTVARLVLLQIVVGAVVLVAVVVAGTVVVRRSLRPLAAVAGTASAITGGDLSHRVPATDPGTEAGAVAQALNSMLERLQTSFAQREEALDEAQASEARMRQFAADASHELRTPLTSVRGIAELYRQGAVPPEGTAEAFGRVEKESRRMGELVEELLLLARLDAHRPLAREPVDLLEVCRDAVAAVSTEREVALEVLPGSTAPLVAGDGRRLRQVVDNLVANALQHGRGRVTVSVGTGADLAVLSVHDEGPGVPAEDREKVFDRFYRGAADRSRDTGGSGLGLSIVAAIVAAHGGRVDVEAATFTLKMPLFDRV